MNQISKEDLKKIKAFIKKSDIEDIATKTGFSVSYVRKVLCGTKCNIKILVSASETALLRKSEMDNNVKKFETNVGYIARK